MRTESRHAIAAGLVAALTLLAGCLTNVPAPGGDEVPRGSTGSAPGACAPVGGPHASGNAPLLAPFRGEPLNIATRFADAVRDPLASTEPDPQLSSEDRPKYRTASTGTVSVNAGGLPDVPPSVEWFGGSDAEPYALNEPHDAFLNATLTRFGLPPSLFTTFTTSAGEDHRVVHFRQAFDGEWVDRTGGSFRPNLPMLVLEPAFDFGNVTVHVSENASADTARERVRCELDASGHTQGAGYAFTRVGRIAWAVVDESLVRRVLVEFTEPEESHCGLVYEVDVDVETGDVLAWQRPPCD